MQAEVIKIGEKLFSMSEKEINSPEPALRNMARLFFLKTEKLYLFAREVEGVEPTNNRAERAIRCAVQWRKTSFGNRGEQGKEATAHLLTLIHSCRMQDRNPYVFLVDCIRAYRRSTSYPSLLSPLSEVPAPLS